MSAVRRTLLAAGHGYLVASLAMTLTDGSFKSQVNPEPVFVPGPCPAHARTSANIDTSWIRCGTVTLPQNRDTPNAKLARVVLPVIVYEAPAVRTKSPLIFLAGGPGESGIDVLTDIFLDSPVGQLLLRERPIIAFNQRGIVTAASGGSPDLGLLAYQWRATRESSIEALVDSAKRITGRLRAQGIQPANFTTLRVVEDTRDIVHALGYQRVTLFATSYGTRLALEIMRVHPDMVEAAIMDGVAPPQRNDTFDPQLLDQRRRAVAARLVEDCEKSSPCSSEYRELRVLANALDRTDAPPVHVVINLPSGGGWFDLHLPGRNLLSAVGAYAGTEFARALPQVLEELARGDTMRRPVSPELVLHVVHEIALLNTAGPNYPVVYHVVLCGDIPSGVLQAGGRAVCNALGVPFSGPEAIAPVTSDIPTLMLSSEYDAQTPPDMAEEASRTLSRSYRILFPGIGHLAYARLVTASCVAVISNAFLLDPTQAPPDPCSKSLMPSFLPRSADLILVPR
jgi:pimeloyl-ACP methyl ester carboxylesterase